MRAGGVFPRFVWGVSTQPQPSPLNLCMATMHHRLVLSQNCYHTSAGNVRCFPERGSHRVDVTLESGFGGGADGQLVDKDCLMGYAFLGVTCSRPMQPTKKATHSDATAVCGTQGDMLYFPPIKMQNLVFREALYHKNPGAGHTVWIGIERVGDQWITSNGQKVTTLMAHWADGEPIVAGNCAIADAKLGLVYIVSIHSKVSHRPIRSRVALLLFIVF
jgi:hypothetical protein